MLIKIKTFLFQERKFFWQTKSKSASKMWFVPFLEAFDCCYKQVIWISSLTWTTVIIHVPQRYSIKGFRLYAFSVISFFHLIPNTITSYVPMNWWPQCIASATIWCTVKLQHTLLWCLLFNILYPSLALTFSYLPKTMIFSYP